MVYILLPPPRFLLDSRDVEEHVHDSKDEEQQHDSSIDICQSDRVPQLDVAVLTPLA